MKRGLFIGFVAGTLFGQMKGWRFVYWVVILWLVLHHFTIHLGH